MAFSPVTQTVARSLRLCALPALLVGIAFLTACHPPAVTDPNDPKFIVAEKDNWTITRAELNTEVDSFLKQRQATREMVGPAKLPFLETAMLKNMVLKKLLLAQAATMQLKDVDKDAAAQLDQLKGPDNDADFAAKLQKVGMTIDDLKQRIHDTVVVRKVLEAQAFKNVDPTEQEIDAIYLSHKDAFNIPAKLRASRILIHIDDTTTVTDKAAKKKIIDKAHERVVKGEDFSKVAMEISEDRSSAPKGGDIGYFQLGENEPGFDDVAFKTKVNTVSPVFQTTLGYQFVKITESQPAGVVPVADARGIISSKLREMKMQQQSQDYAKKLIDNSGVTYHLKLVDLPAQTGAPGLGGPGGPPPDAQPAPGSAPDSSAPAPGPSK